MEKQRKLILYISILIIVILGVVVYFSKINNFNEKTLFVSQKLEEPKKVIDLGFQVTKNSDSLVIDNTENNFKLILPQDWQVADNSYGSQLLFYSGDVEMQEIGTEITKGIKLEVVIQPADQGLTLAENIESFFPNVENYKEVEVNGLPAVVVESNDSGYSKSTYVFDDIEGLMFILAGYDGGGDGTGDFATIYDEIVNSFILTNR